MDLEREKPKLSLIDRLRGRTAGMVEHEAAAQRGEAELQCQANWLSSSEERCPCPADRLIEVDIPAGELKMGVCEQHKHLVSYLDGSHQSTMSARVCGRVAKSTATALQAAFQVVCPR